ncbi:MAG: prolyl oligopeptidase family serine peptidase, partial [Proteobacteria bacterium]|nr:prolyl oligopeptidase family serine peptidase [Pseudomonadota bacterium]
AKDLLLDLRVQLTLDSFLQKNEALRLAGQKGFSEIFRLLINQSNIQMDVFIQEACNVLPQKVFPLEGVYRPHRPAQKPVFAPFRIISNNDKYIDPNVNVLGEKGKPLVHKDGKTPIGYNVHLPPAGVEIKNVIVEVYGGNQAKDRSIQAYKPGAIGTFEQHLVNEGTVVITLNLPDLLENDVFQSQISEKLHKKIHDCIDHFHKTLTTSPESLHVELAPLKDKPTFLYGASFGGLNAVHHAQKNPGTFTGYIAHNGALDMHLDRLGREYKPHLNVARKEQMDKIKDPVLLMGTEADNNVFIKMILSFYNQLNEQQKRELVRLGITPKGNLGNNVNKGHFVPDDSEELALYLQRINDFMREGPSKLPEFSDLLGYEQELLANKYANKGSLKDKFIADALMIKDQKKHTHSASIVKAWETDYKPIFNAFWVAEECTQTELYYNAEVQRLVYGNLLSDEVIFNLLKSQTELLKQFFEDKHFPLSSQLDLMPCLNNKQVFDKIRDEITKPQKPFNKSKQQYLLLALYKANPALLKTHEERLPTVKDYNDELADAQREFLQKAKQVHERRKKLWQGVVMKSSPRTAGYFEESRKIEAEKNKKAMREATVGKLQAAIDLFKFEPQVNFFDKNNVLQIELFRKAIIPKKTEGKNYLDVPTTWSEWWYGTQGGDKALLESMRYFYSECDILLKTVSKQSAELVQQFQNLELDPAKEDELRKSLTLLEKQFMGMQILKEELKAGIKDMVQDKVRFKNLDQYWSAEFVKTSEDCRNIFYENRGKMSLALERTASKKTGPAL